MEDHLWLLWDCLGDVLMGCGLPNMLESSIWQPSVCIFGEDGPIVHTMVSMERNQSMALMIAKKQKGVGALVFHFKHLFYWITAQDGVALSISLFLKFLLLLFVY